MILIAYLNLKIFICYFRDIFRTLKFFHFIPLTATREYVLTSSIEGDYPIDLIDRRLLLQ